MRNRRMLTVTLGIVVALVFGIVVAYAALSSTLNLKFNGVTQNALSWNVGFNGYNSHSYGGTSSTGRSCGSASVSSNSITINSTTISKPGDYCQWEFGLCNKGNIAAKVSGITANSPTSVSCTKSGTTMVCGNLTYTFTGVSTSSTLSENSCVTVYMKVEYTGTSLNYSAVTHSNPGYTISFAQE